jgi:addiction module RelE/StbE family toxin
VYKLEYLPSAVSDILETEAGLYEFSPAAADKFTDAIQHLTETLRKHPLMYQIYEDDAYFRSMPLPYDYRLFYHVAEETETIRIHRVIHGMRELNNLIGYV